MSQPFNRAAVLPALGKVDHEAGEFWVPNPWAFSSSPYNLSAFERNRTYWNVAGQEFFDLSYISGLDSDADSRGCVAADITGDGMPELILRNSGGGPVRVFRNEMPRNHYLRVSLRGTQSNRYGVGSRLRVRAGGRTMVRDLYPENSYAGQSPPEVNFGLGDATAVDQITIRWPSGLEQTLTHVAADQCVVVNEGDPTVIVMP